MNDPRLQFMRKRPVQALASVSVVVLTAVQKERKWAKKSLKKERQKHNKLDYVPLKEMTTRHAAAAAKVLEGTCDRGAEKKTSEGLVQNVTSAARDCVGTKEMSNPENLDHLYLNSRIKEINKKGTIATAKLFKWCSGCGLDFIIECFSKAEWKKSKSGSRKCLECKPAVGVVAACPLAPVVTSDKNNPLDIDIDSMNMLQLRDLVEIANMSLVGCNTQIEIKARAQQALIRLELASQDFRKVSSKHKM